MPAVLAANPRLADAGPVLPAGVLIVLPDLHRASRAGPTLGKDYGASCETRDRPSFSLPEAAGRGTVSGRDAAFAGWQ